MLKNRRLLNQSIDGMNESARRSTLAEPGISPGIRGLRKRGSGMEPIMIRQSQFTTLLMVVGQKFVGRGVVGLIREDQAPPDDALVGATVSEHPLGRPKSQSVVARRSDQGFLDFSELPMFLTKLVGMDRGPRRTRLFVPGEPGPATVDTAARDRRGPRPRRGPATCRQPPSARRGSRFRLAP